jgi:hypothetical protein
VLSDSRSGPQNDCRRAQQGAHSTLFSRDSDPRDFLVRKMYFRVQFLRQVRVGGVGLTMGSEEDALERGGGRELLRLQNRARLLAGDPKVLRRKLALCVPPVHSPCGILPSAPATISAEGHPALNSAPSLCFQAWLLAFSAAVIVCRPARPLARQIPARNAGPGLTFHFARAVRYYGMGTS